MDLPLYAQFSESRDLVQMGRCIESTSVYVQYLADRKRCFFGFSERLLVGNHRNHNLTYSDEHVESLGGGLRRNIAANIPEWCFRRHDYIPARHFPGNCAPDD